MPISGRVGGLAAPVLPEKRVERGFLRHWHEAVSLNTLCYGHVRP